ncbi:MAG: class I tRNA ligase family protein [Candidatus Moduliflexus flocculans]|nr:class I tRNA ligase family protein [Candidatus Moduliflexus flocculans]
MVQRRDRGQLERLRPAEAPSTRSWTSSTLLNNWYIRRSRRRFWKLGRRQRTRREAYATLHARAAAALPRAPAPFMPFITDDIWRNLRRRRRRPESIHLARLARVRRRLPRRATLEREDGGHRARRVHGPRPCATSTTSRSASPWPPCTSSRATPRSAPSSWRWRRSSATS